jgi:hypothetical protein
MRQVNVEVFRSDELKGKSREKMLQFGREIIRNDYSITLKEDIKYFIEEKYGISTSRLEYNLNYCQGDGVAFYGNLDLDKLQEKNPEITKILDNLEGIDYSIEIQCCSYNYHHKNSMNVVVESNSDNENLLKLREFINSLLREASVDAEYYGYSIIENQESDELVVNYFNANGFEFLKDGTLFDVKIASQSE